MTYVDLTSGDLALAALLLLVNGLISLGFGLRLETSLAAAAVRMVVQLGVLGLLLKLVFEQASPLWTGVAALAMVAVAGGELLRRQAHRFRGLFVQGSGHLLLFTVGGLATLYALVVIGPTPWYAPRYVLPILAMVTGGTLTTAGVALETLVEGALSERAGIEARMALDAGRFTAFRPLLRRTLHSDCMAAAQDVSGRSAFATLAVVRRLRGRRLAWFACTRPRGGRHAAHRPARGWRHRRSRSAMSRPAIPYTCPHTPWRTTCRDRKASAAASSRQ